MKAKGRLNKPLKGIVILTGFDESGDQVIEDRLDVADYYSSLHPLLDDATELRLQLGVRQVRGVVYNYEGYIDQKFTNEYGDDGAYIRSHITFSDGTVAE